MILPVGSGCAGLGRDEGAEAGKETAAGGPRRRMSRRTTPRNRRRSGGPHLGDELVHLALQRLGLFGQLARSRKQLVGRMSRFGGGLIDAGDVAGNFLGAARGL